MTLTLSPDPCQRCGLHPGVFYFYPLCVCCHTQEQADLAEARAQWVIDARAVLQRMREASDDD